MKKLFQITLTALLTAISVSAVADTYYLRVGRQNNPDVAADYIWSDGSNPVNNVCTWTITPMQSGNCFLWLCSAKNTSNIVSLPSSYTFTDAQGLTNWKERQDFGGKYMLLISLKSNSEFTISWNISTHAITIGSAVTSYTVNTSCAHGTFTPTSATVAQGGSAVFTFTPAAGYSYVSHSVTVGTATVTKNGDTFTVVPTSNCTLTVECSKKSYSVKTSLTEGSIDPTSATVDYDADITFGVTPPTGKQINKTATNYSGIAEISYEGDEITLNNVQSAGTLTVVFSSDEKPVVYWEQYPTLGVNAVNMHGYLAERHCLDVTGAGFYWKETNDITASDISNPVTGHKIEADNVPAKNGNSFHKTNADFSALLNEPTTIYLVNYVTTSGGTGISDVVALVYEPCFPVESVTLNNSAVSLPEGYKFTFEATARSAGKTPVYKWYLGDALIEGAASNTYEFTMPDTDPHTIKVEVTGGCGVSMEANANITSCTIPEVALVAEATTTPWADVEISATQSGVGSAEWSVEPKAELNNANVDDAIFRAGTPGTYTVKYVGASSECDATVNAEAEIEITVNADSEDCKP